MKLAARFCVTAAALGLSAQIAAQPTDPVTVIHAGTLMAEPGKAPLTNASVIVRGGRIESVQDGFSPPPAGARLVDLSDRESEVLALIAKGLTNAQIAEELYLSIETVKTYVKRLYAKLDVHNRAQAAVAASSHQLTPRDIG